MKKNNDSYSEEVSGLMVFFDKNESDIDVNHQKQLLDFVHLMPADKRFSLVIAGHADQEGSNSYKEQHFIFCAILIIIWDKRGQSLFGDLCNNCCRRKFR